MNNQNLEGKLLPELREIAKELGIKKVESFKKNELIDLITKGNTASTTSTTTESSPVEKASKGRPRKNAAPVATSNPAKKDLFTETSEAPDISASTKEETVEAPVEKKRTQITSSKISR